MIQLTMVVRAGNGSVVTTVGPINSFTNSSGIGYDWACSSAWPSTHYGEVRALVVDTAGSSGSGTWYTPTLTC